MGGAVFAPCLTWSQSMVEVMKIMAIFFKRSHAGTAALGAPNPAAGHHWPTPLLETLEHSQASLGQSLVDWSIKGWLLSMSSERSIVSCYSPVLSRWQWWLVFSKFIICGNLESLSVFLFLCVGRVNGDLCRMEFSVSALQCISPSWNLAP